MTANQTLPAAGQAEQLLLFTDVLTIRVPQATTHGQYAIFEEEVPPLGGPPPHTHPDEEIFYILSGEFQFVLHDLNKPFAARAGSLVHVPSGALHTFKNVGPTAGKMLVLLTPGNLEQYFRQVSTPIADPGQKPDLSVPPDLSKIDPSRAFALAQAHQVEFFLPQLIPSQTEE